MDDVQQAIQGGRRTFSDNRTMPKFTIRVSPNYGDVSDFKTSKRKRTLLFGKPREIHYVYSEGGTYDHLGYGVADKRLRWNLSHDDDVARGERIGEHEEQHEHTDHTNTEHEHDHNDRQSGHHHKDQSQCLRPAWYRNYYPSCNSFHELDFLGNTGTLLG
jgi:hypothetical protein